MALRNFWITGRSDGRSTPVTMGPRSKDGGFELTVAIRRDGGSYEAITIIGSAVEGDRLKLSLSCWDGSTRVLTTQR